MRAERLDTESRRAQIARAALDLMADGGPRRLQMARLARRVGIVTSAIYRHFKNKDEVLDAVLDLVAEGLRTNLRLAGSAPDPLTGLRDLLLAHVTMIRDNRAIPRVVFGEYAFSERPDRRGRLHTVVTAYLSGIADIVHQGQAAGLVDASCDPDTAAVAILGTIQATAAMWAMSDGAFDAVAHVSRALTLLEQGLLPRP